MFYAMWHKMYLAGIQAVVAAQIDSTSFMRYNGDGSVRVLPNIGSGC